MKFSLSVFFFSVFGAYTLVLANPNNQKEPPKFETTLPTEKFIIKEKIAAETVYGFATNKSVDELEDLLIKSLGQGWTLQVAPDRIIKMLSEERNLQLEGFGRLLHEDYAGFTITATLTPLPKRFKNDNVNYRRLLSIVMVNRDLTEHLKLPL